jgi:hypothetical protein
MNVDKKILEEISKFNKINNYILEQGDVPPPPGGDVPPPPGGDVPPPPGPEGAVPPGGDVPPPPGPEGAPPAPPAPVDLEVDTEVEKVDDEGNDEKEGKEELEITDLVDAQKTIQDKQDEYFENLFNQLSGLEEKLSSMDELVNKINKLEDDFQRYRPKTPKEKLELRTLDSGPYNQKLTDFFMDKQEDLEKSGKNEYVLTSDDVKEYSPKEIEGTFDYEDDENDTDMM